MADIDASAAKSCVGSFFSKLSKIPRDSSFSFFQVSNFLLFACLLFFFSF